MKQSEDALAGETESCSVSQYQTRGATVVTVTGAVDALTAPMVHTVLDEALSSSPPVLVVDLLQVDFLASAGMSVLVAVREAMPVSSRFAIVADGPATSRPLTVIGVAELVELYPRLDAALDALTA